MHCYDWILIWWDTRLIFMTCARVWALRPTPSSFSGSSVETNFFCLRARVTTDALKYMHANGRTRQHVQLFEILEKAKDISQHISCFLSLSHENRKYVHRSNLILLSPSRFFSYWKKAEDKETARRTPEGSLTILARKQEDGCDLDRMCVRDKRFVWTSELNWTDRRELIKKNRKKERTTTSFFF